MLTIWSEPLNDVILHVLMKLEAVDEGPKLHKLG
jgi:hypothetical protein